MGKPKKETVRKLRGLMILDQMEDYTPLHICIYMVYYGIIIRIRYM